MKTAVALMLLLPGLAFAQVRSTDEVLDQTRLTELLSGSVIEFFDGSKSRYKANGRYGYTYTDDGPVWAGDYTIHDQSRVCVTFDNGSSRCDHFVRDGARVVLVIEDGTRFPARQISPITP